MAPCQWFHAERGSESSLSRKLSGARRGPSLRRQNEEGGGVRGHPRSRVGPREGAAVRARPDVPHSVGGPGTAPMAAQDAVMSVRPGSG